MNAEKEKDGFRRYLGIKKINAKPMTRLEYNDFRSWDLPSDENGDDLGYLVEYIEGGKPNTKEYKGYVSWSPKEVFENAYTTIFAKEFEITKELEPYQQRVLVEHSELCDKLSKLEAYINTLGKTNDLLTKQHNYMFGYMTILRNRIEEWV